MAREIDPTYAAAWQEARAAGVEMLAYGVQLAPDELRLARRLAVAD